MYRRFLLCLLAGLSAQTLNSAAAADKSGNIPRDHAQSQTETGQSGTGGEGAGGGQPYIGGAGMTGTGGEGKAETPTRGGMENHVKEAMKHAKAAADSGKKDDDEGMAKHVGAAKPHVETAIQQNPNKHLTPR